jgi:tetratricopeptide (TPR) repeat protein
VDRSFPLLPLGVRRVGRDTELAEVHDRLARGRLVVLQGAFSGVGASHVASEYGHAHVSDYPGGMVWIPYRCSGAKESAADVVDSLHLPNEGGLRWPYLVAEDSVATMWHDLGRSTKSVLIVLDGFRRPETVEHWRPRHPHIHVIAIADPGASVESGLLLTVERIAAPDVLGAIRRAQPKIGEHTCSRLVEALAGDALAIDMALSKLSAETDVDAFLAEVTSRADEAVLTHAIGEQTPEARTVLAALALLDAEPVPVPLLHAIVEGLGDATGRIDACLDALVAARLVERTRQGMLVAHARVLVRVLDVSGGRREAVARALLRVFAETKDPDARRVLAPHARLAVRQAAAAPALLSELAVVVSAEGASRHAFGTDEAQRGVAFARAAEGEAGGALTLRALNTQGYVLSELRELVEAQKVLRQALTLAEEKHGPESPEVVEALNRLSRAIGLSTCGDPSPEALSLEARALAIHEKLWGSEDPRLAPAVWKLGVGLAVKGRLDEAIPLVERAIKLTENSGDPWIEKYLDSLANLLASVGRTDDAIDKARRALNLRRQRNIKYVTNTLASVADGLAKTGGSERVIELANEVLGWQEWHKRSESEATLAHARIHELLATTRARLGRHEEAAEDAALALPTLAAWYGPSAPHVLRVRAIAERRGARDDHD